MKRLYFLIAILLSSATSYAQLTSPQVDTDEVIRRGDMVEYVDGYGDEEDPIGEALAPPPDDSHKWYITVLTSEGCGHCERLKRDFAESIDLRAFVIPEDYKDSWAHYNVYSMDDVTQSWRFKAPASTLKIKGYPTLLVQPPFNGKYGPSKTIVLQKTGYDGNPKKLARQLSDSIKRYVTEVTPSLRAGSKFKVRGSKFESRARCDCACENCACNPCLCRPEPRPLNPEPLLRGQSDATAEDANDRTAMVRSNVWGQRQPPFPFPGPNDPAPVVPPLVIPGPLDPDAPAPVAPDAKPDDKKPDDDNEDNLPEAVLVVDSQNEQPLVEAQARRFLERLRVERKGLRVRIIDWAFAKNDPDLAVQRDETPAVVVTDGNRVDTISGRLFPLLAPSPAPAAQVTIADLPWQSLLLLLTGSGGIGAAVPLILFGIRWFRSRRQASGRQTLLNQESFDGLLQVLQQMDLVKLLAQFKK